MLLWMSKQDSCLQEEMGMSDDPSCEQEALAIVEIMSGPDDGTVHKLNRQGVRLGPTETADIRVDCDAKIPEEGYRIHIEDDSVAYENVATGERTSKPYGDVIRIGRIEIAVYPSSSEKADEPSGSAPEGGRVRDEG